MVRRRSQSAISLFPFLAVLVCTMGALILLLLVTTRRIRRDQQNVAEVVATATEQTDDVPAFVQSKHPAIALLPPNSAASELPGPESLPPEPDAKSLFDLRWEIDQLKATIKTESARQQKLRGEIALVANQLTDDTDGDELAALRSQELTALQRHEKQLEEELQQRRSQLQTLQTDLDSISKTAEDAEHLLRKRESALISLRELVKDSQQPETAGTDKTVVEFSNATGTERTPVIVNVTEDGYEFLPSGIRVTADDMQGFPGNDNPLLAGVLAVHEHRFPDSTTVKPYVLLLVRPDGSLPFYSAQRTMADAGIHSGYELLSQDQQVDTGRKNPEEAESMRNAILAALNRRTNLYSGLIATINSLTPPNGARPQQKFRVMPDGRVVMSGEGSDNREGRFYAGGEAPRPNYSDLFRRPQVPQRSRELTADSEVANSEGENRAGSAGEQRPEEPAEPSNPFAELNHLLDSHAAQEAEAGEDNGPLIAPRFGVPASPVEERSSPESPIAESDNSLSPEFLRQQQLQQLDRPGPLLGNLGSGPDTDAPLSRKSEGSANSRRPVTNSNSRDQDSQAPSGWPSSATAPADEATRTAGRAENPNPSRNAEYGVPSQASLIPFDRPPASSGQGQFGASGAFGSAQGDAGAGPPASTDAENLLQEFLRKVQQQKADAAADPFLLTLLEQGQRHQIAELQGRYPVSVVLGPQQLTIANFETIDIRGWDAQQVLAITLEALAAEMERKPALNGRYALPTVDFQVAPGAWSKQQILAQQLRKMGVPTRSARQQMTPIVSETIPPTRENSRQQTPSSDPQPSASPIQESADPIEIPAPAPRRRMSI